MSREFQARIAGLRADLTERMRRNFISELPPSRPWTPAACSDPALDALPSQKAIIAI